MPASEGSPAGPRRARSDKRDESDKREEGDERDERAEALRGRIQGGVVRFIAQVVLYNHVVSQRLGLSASDSQFLTLLDLHGPLTPGRLATLSGMTTGTVTGVLDRLERAGLVQRARDPGDRRRVLVSRREDTLAEKVFPHYREQGEHLRAVLSRRDLRELTVIAEFLDEVSGGGPG